MWNCFKDIRKWMVKVLLKVWTGILSAFKRQSHKMGVGFCWRIVWVCLTIFVGLALKGLRHQAIIVQLLVINQKLTFLWIFCCNDCSFSKFLSSFFSQKVPWLHDQCWLSSSRISLSVSDAPAISEMSLELLLLQVVLPAFVEQGHARRWLKTFVGYWARMAAYTL